MFRKKVGLALGAGAARGWAQMGVISVLEREGIHVDMVAGTSVGSVTGALCAQGRTAGEMKKLGKRLLSMHPFRDPAFPGSGVIKGNKMKELLSGMFGGDITFRDLKLPFACVATDILTGEEVVIRDGSIADALRASMSMPGIFTVVNRGGRYLVDGILANPVPVSVVKEMGADYVIAVNVIPVVYKPGPDEAPKEPRLADVIVQALHIGSYSLSRASLSGASIVIAPKVGHIGASEFSRADEFIRLGESAAQECVAHLKRSSRRYSAGVPLGKGGPAMARLSFLRQTWFMVLASGLLLFFGTDWALSATSNPGYVPSVLLIGAFLVPVTFVVYTYEVEPDKEIPLGSIAMTFLWGGVLGAVVAGYLEFQTAQFMPVLLVIGVGIIEEAAKLILPLIFFFRDRYCPEADGLLFGVTAGMGFAALETMGYGFVVLLQSQGNVDVLHQTLLVRGLLSPAGHAAWTGIICSVLWRERDKVGRSVFNRPVVWAIVAAIALHSMWNIAGSISSMMGPEFVALDFIGLFGVAGISMWLLIRRMKESRHLNHPPAKTCSGP